MKTNELLVFDGCAFRVSDEDYAEYLDSNNFTKDEIKKKLENRDNDYFDFVDSEFEFHYSYFVESANEKIAKLKNHSYSVNGYVIRDGRNSDIDVDEFTTIEQFSDIFSILGNIDLRLSYISIDDDMNIRVEIFNENNTVVYNFTNIK